ncbi:hypothetical protein KAI56_04885, partial [Candidatus Parcubacteria bacterium]|nr:hypothetical protein [Candidatus Parcubacteria bacterium]
VEERKANGKFAGIEDFVLRVESRDLNKKSMEGMIKAGAFDSIEERNKLLSNLERILIFAKERQQAKNNGQVSLFGSDSTDDNSINKLQLINTEPAKKEDTMAWEKELLGLYVSDHPLKEYSVYLRNNSKSVRNLTSEDVNQVITVGGIITKIQKIVTRAGQSMVFATMEDLTDKIEILVFPRLLESNAEIWAEGNIVFVKGKVSDKDGVFKLLGESIRKIDLEEAKKDQTEKELINDNDNSENNGSYYQKNNSLGGAGVIRDNVKKQKIEITIPSSDNSKILLQKLSDLLKSVPAGNCEVYLLLNLPDGSFRKIKTSRDVEYGENILNKIKEVVGEKNVR